MNASTLSFAPFRRLSNTIGLMFQRPARRQVGALCYRKRKNKVEVLLITSRDTGRWIIPKGWPGSKLSARKQAAREAYEEAGIRGKIGKEPLAEYPSAKGLGKGFKVKTNVTVFPLETREQLKKFPERGQRKLAWMSIDDAAKQCDDPGLQQIFVDPDVKSMLINQ